MLMMNCAEEDRVETYLDDDAPFLDDDLTLRAVDICPLAIDDRNNLEH